MHLPSDLLVPELDNEEGWKSGIYLSKIRWWKVRLLDWKEFSGKWYLAIHMCIYEYVNIYLEANWPLFWLEFGPCFGGAPTFKSRGHGWVLGIIYIIYYLWYKYGIPYLAWERWIFFFGPTWVGSSQLDPVVNNHGTTTHWDDPPSSEEYLGSPKVANESLGWDSPLKMQTPLLLMEEILHHPTCTKPCK